MNITSLTRSLAPAVLASALLLTRAAAAQSAPPGIVGSYSGVVSGPSLGDVSAVLSIADDAGTLHGTLAAQSQVIPLTGVAFAHDELRFSFEFSGMPVLVTAQLAESQLHGTYRAGPETGTVILRRLGAGEDHGARLAALTTAQWREDIAYFSEQLQHRHMQLFHFATPAAFNAAGASLTQAVPDLQPDAIVTRLSEIAAMIGDAHTRVLTPTEFHHFPVTLFWFGTQLRIVAAAPPYASILGRQVLAIDATPIAKIRTAVDALVSQDETPWYELDRTPVLLGSAEKLHALRIISSATAPATFTLRDDGGRVTQSAVTPVPNDSPDGQNPFVTPALAPDEPGTLTSTYIGRSHVVVARFDGYDDLEPRAAALFKLLDAHRDARLLIDLRKNGGGDFQLGRRFLVEPIRARPWITQPGRFFVAIGRATFSAAVANAADFKKLGATLVGEPAGERPNGYQESQNLVLPNSGIRVTYSTQLYHFLDGPENILRPDVALPPSWQALQSGTDPALAWLASRSP